ncbi:TlyA family RNA methyltransferase [Limisalsivibrio acetivorans]|uniref:TlyA family RNA methyltransferase n=1 Tax=Limisalsivibrio acetivorans TaxID=1304888 RepID=UPI0003B68F6B|nr:TlyA family RNA methyltransferase [Limisalsivibrio acetivorans]
MKKKRIDTLLVEYGLAESAEHASRLLMAGLVVAGEHRVDKPGDLVDPSLPIRLKETLPYVSRGGLKLERAVELFSIDFKDKVVIDIGSSTGGFTDVALKSGAERIYAVDSGFNQLHESLRRESRVVSLEETNFRTIDFDTIGEKADVIVSDVSFISLEKIIPSAVQFCSDNTEVVLLIKPQFEVRREQVGKGGIVEHEEYRAEAVVRVCRFAVESGFGLFGLASSPIKGAKGNVEYLAHFVYNCPTATNTISSALEQVIHEKGFYSSKAPRG